MIPPQSPCSPQRGTQKAGGGVLSRRPRGFSEGTCDWQRKSVGFNGTMHQSNPWKHMDFFTLKPQTHKKSVFWNWRRLHFQAPNEYSCERHFRSQTSDGSNLDDKKWMVAWKCCEKRAGCKWSNCSDHSHCWVRNFRIFNFPTLKQSHGSLGSRPSRTAKELTALGSALREELAGYHWMGLVFFLPPEHNMGVSPKWLVCNGESH
jgi:hypothetical protein